MSSKSQRPGPRPGSAKPPPRRSRSRSRSAGPGPRPAQTQRLREQQAAAKRRAAQQRLKAVLAVALVVLLLGGGIAWQHWRTTRDPRVAAETGAAAGPFAAVAITDGRPITLGQADAPVTITLYEDFHCSHCVDFEEELGPTVTAAQQSGRVAVELYPMAIVDPESSAAASNAMACAAEAGFGQRYYHGLFANSTLEWNSGQLRTLAAKVSDTVPASFTACVTQTTHADWVQSINAAAAANQVAGTPTMFLDGAPVDISSLTPATLQTMIDQAATT